jgi:acyl carrier protein
MDRQALVDRLKTAIREEPRIFVGKALDLVQPEDRLREDVGMDSVGLLYLVMAVEEAFDLEVEDAEDLVEHFTTWGDLITYIEGQQA